MRYQENSINQTILNPKYSKLLLICISNSAFIQSSFFPSVSTLCSDTYSADFFFPALEVFTSVQG